MKQNDYEITFIDNNTNKKVTNIYSSKMQMIKHYIEFNTIQMNISELKAIKNDKDYTNTLNKFLFN